MKNDFEDALTAMQKEVWQTATIDIPNLKALINESAGGVDVSGLQARMSALETKTNGLPAAVGELSALKPKLIPVTIFDCSSSDASINLGFSSAVKPSEVISANFSLYRKIVVHMKATSSGNVCAFEVPISQGTAVQNSSFMFPSTRQGWSGIFLQLSADKQILTYSACSHFSTETSGGTTTLSYQNSTTSSYGAIEKIEGYLKF